MWTGNKRFVVAPAGRRSGKTELAKRRLVMSLALKKPWPDPRYFAAAPTREQAKRIFWKDLRLLTPQRWIKRVYETDLCIVTRLGSELWVVGLDRPQRIEGVPWDGGVLDEYANMKAGAWEENIRPALSDRGGWCWLIGVPEGLNHYKDLADYALSGSDPEWGMYTWTSASVLEPKEIEAAKRVLDPRTFRQEYEASFEGAASRVYYAYDAKRHEDAAITVDPKLPLIISCDFNVGTCVFEVLQAAGDHVRVIDEIVLRDTNTIEMGKAAIARYGGHKAGVVIYGDAAGKSRTTTGASDYAILASLGFGEQRIKRANPPVKDRVNALNAMLENVNGEVRLTHHPRCRALRKDFETVTWEDNGAEINKLDNEKTHATDALGYFIEYEFGLRLNRPDAHRRFYK
ncbi:MAG: terminase family protein [Deltaproteobacteria bacterium]|jgi:hypothetical protein